MIHYRILIAAFALLQQQFVLAAPTSNVTATSISAALHSSSPSHTPVHTSTSSSTAAGTTFTAGLTSDDPNDSFLGEFQNETPEAIRGTLGATVIGPQNIPLDRQSPDLLAPPSTDVGSVDNAKWPFSFSHNRLQTGGWARQQNVETMPIATAMAGVNMRLEAGAIRELHWHALAEWGYVLKGTTRITALTPDGQNYEADINPGDVWYFPAGYPHSLQGTNVTADGSEFLLVFDNGNFDEDDTFPVSDWLAHVPKEVLAKNFGADISAFDDIPAKELYIFPGTPPPPIQQDEVSDPLGQANPAISFAWSQVTPTPLKGGSFKVLDSTNFPIAQTIAAADVIVEVGGMREMHWHPTQAEWSYFISGQARVTIFAGVGNSVTFNYQAGDIGYVPPSNGHYVENIGNETLHFLEIFRSDKFEDVSLNQWLALTPPRIVEANLNIDSATVALLNKTKQTVYKGGCMPLQGVENVGKPFKLCVAPVTVPVSFQPLLLRPLMHRILFSPEILGEIFSYSSKHTDTVTARVCRIWFTNSIRFIWNSAQLNIAMGLLSLSTAEKTVDNDAERPLLPQAWDRFFLYSSSVRCLKCVEVDYSALKQMIFWRPSADLFPSLTRLEWSGPGGCIKYLTPLLTLSLQRLYISADRIEGPEMADGLCQTVATRSPYLRFFGLNMPKSDDHIFSRPLGKLMLNLSRLTIAVVPSRFMTPELFIILSRAPNLKGLVIPSSTANFVDDHFEENLMKQKLICDQEFSPFYPLTDLVISDSQTFTTSTVLEHGFHFLNLTQLVCSPQTKTSEELTSLMGTVHVVCPILKIITIKRPSGPSASFSWPAIQALLKCPRLRALEVFGRTVDIGLSELLTVATNRSSWQRIHLPSIQPLSCQALIVFAQKCPKLVKLGLTLDTLHGLPDLQTLKADVLFSSLHTLNVGDSPLTSPVEVGLFLSQICGNTLTIRSNEGKYSKLWKLVMNIINDMNSSARVRILNKEVEALRGTIAELKSSLRRTESTEFKIKVDVKNEN